MNLINPNRDNVYSKLNSDFENSPEVSEKISPELKDVIAQINRGDLGLPSHALKAGAFQYEARCGLANKNFMLCKRENGGDPRKCLKENNMVADCASNFYKAVTDACTKSFVDFAQCLEHNPERSYKFCRPEQHVFDHCVFSKLGMDKASARTNQEQQFALSPSRDKPVNPLGLPKISDPEPVYPDWGRPLKLPKITQETGGDRGDDE